MANNKISSNYNKIATYSMFNNNTTKSAKEISLKFKNMPNLELRGSTYDVRHLDKFIKYS